jgi:hypothetical protein
MNQSLLSFFGGFLVLLVMCDQGVCALNVPRLFSMGAKDVSEAMRICPKLDQPLMKPSMVLTADIALG